MDTEGVTILLSQTVFSLLVGHVITKTSEAIPLIVSPSLETDLCFYSALAALSTLEIELLHFKFVLLKYVAKQTLSKADRHAATDVSFEHDFELVEK
uniref:SFRICE_022884 n=1 Tax=Spodoptera frugiperda TaxID=7108 RepID=A0A2H1VA51_SPOFR